MTVSSRRWGEVVDAEFKRVNLEPEGGVDGYADDDARDAGPGDLAEHS